MEKINTDDKRRTWKIQDARAVTDVALLTEVSLSKTFSCIAFPGASCFALSYFQLSALAKGRSI